VLEDVPPYALVVGVPARILRYRFSPAEIDVLLKVRWWDWDDGAILANRDCFADPAIFFSRFTGR